MFSQFLSFNRCKFNVGCRIVYFFSLTFFWSFSFSQVTTQQGHIDSLIGELKHTPRDSTRILLLEKIGYNYSTLDPKKGLDFALKANNLALDLKLKQREGSSLAIVAINLAAAGSYDKAIDYNKKSIEIYKSANYPKGIAAVNANLSQVYLKLGDYSNALDCNFSALEVYDIYEEHRSKAIVLENIGSIYYELNEFSKSGKYYQQALTLNRKFASKLDVARCLGNYSRVFMRNNEYEKALNYLNQAMKINLEHGNRNGVQINLINIGNVYLRQEKFKEALDQFYQSLEISESLDFKNFIAVNKGNIGEVYLRLYKSNMKDSELLGKSIDYLNNAIMICDSIEYPAPKVEFIGILIEAYTLKKNFESAYEFLQIKTVLVDSLNTLAAKEKLVKLESKRDSDIKDKDIIIKDKELQIMKLGFQRKTLIYSLVISVLMFILVLVLRYIRRKVKSHRRVISEIKQVQAHEIRGPIATILGLSNLLKQTHREKGITNQEIIAGIDEMAIKLDKVIMRIIKESDG